MEVTLIDYMGTDLTVVNAARVSFNQESTALNMKDRGLISYLAKHGHWSPFAHCHVQFRIKAPIFVARQLVKHQIGLVWNEVSRRYVSYEPELYFPEEWRIRPPNIKQGSGTALFAGSDLLTAELKAHLSTIVKLYNKMIADGIAPEQARMILPLNLYTEWFWSGSLYAWARVCKLRMDEATQKETRQIAEMIDQYLTVQFPVSWAALTLLTP